MYHRLLSGTRLVFFVLCFIFLAIRLQPVHAKNDPMTSPLFLQCPANAADPDALCDALAAALETVLTEAESARHIRRSQLPPAKSPPIADTDTLRLVLSDVRSDRISGHLTWQAGNSAALTGPEVALDVMDTTLSPKMYPRFVQGLLQASPQIIKSLHD